MGELEDPLRRLESEIERRLVERFAGLKEEFDRLRLESDRRWAGFLSRFDQDFRGLVPPELVPSAAPAAAAATGREISLETARSLEEGGSQVEVLRRFLELCRGHASRVALFVARGGLLGVWKAVGFTERGGDDEAARRIGLDLSDPLLARAMEGTPIRLASGNPVSARLEAGDAIAAVLVPMMVKEKVSGLLYADAARGEETSFDPETVAMLTYFAGLVVDRLASRRLIPPPALRPFEREESPRSAQFLEESLPKLTLALEPAAEAAPPPVAPPPAVEAMPPPAVEVEPEAEVELEATEIESAGEPEPEPPPQPPVLPEPAGMPLAEPEPSPPAEPAGPRLFEPVPSAPAGVRPPDLAASMASEGRISTGARRLAGPLAPIEGDERREEARRFARLLVSEIKLYNERAVFEGRQRGDLYTRLKEDIDRSRQMYDDRIPEDVRASSNFFYEELVRILADGHPEILGL